MFARMMAAFCTGLLLITWPGAATAQDYPSRPVRFIVGPGPDVLARLIALKLSEGTGKQFYVEPLPGAGGVIAAQTTLKSPPDGHTLLLTTGSYSIMQTLNPKLGFNLQHDFEPVSLLGTLAFVLVTHPDLPIKSLDDLLKLARDKPGSINCASSGRGTTAHIGCEMLRTFGKVDIVHVPFSGAGAALNALLGKHVEVMFLTVPQGASYVANGQLRGIAVTGPTRSPTLSDVPTVAEAGLPKLQFVSWNGVHVARGTPQSIVEKLNAQLSKTLTLPEVRERMGTLGLDPRGGTPQEFGQFVKEDIENWTRNVEATAIKSE
jgi:tripartite-type tricarboxylate transporter receptor subunit TctC